MGEILSSLEAVEISVRKNASSHKKFVKKFHLNHVSLEKRLMLLLLVAAAAVVRERRTSLRIGLVLYLWTLKSKVHFSKI